MKSARNNPNDNESQQSLIVPLDIFSKISEFSNYQTIAAFSQNCKMLNRFFQPKLDELVESLVAELLQNAVDGNQAAVLKQLAKYPGLITKCGEVIDKKTGRRVGGTVFRVLLGGSDPMWKKVEPFFEKIKNGEDEKKNQVNAQFPTSYDPSAERKQINEEANTLVDIIIADLTIQFDVNTGQFRMQEATKNALQKWKDYFKPKSDKVVTTGLYLDPDIYADVERVYEKNFQDFKNPEQRSLYCCQVKGPVQKYFPRYPAMVLCKKA